MERVKRVQEPAKKVQTMVWMPEAMHAEVKALAESQDRSIGSVIRRAIALYLSVNPTEAELMHAAVEMIGRNR